MSDVNKKINNEFNEKKDIKLKNNTNHKKEKKETKENNKNNKNNKKKKDNAGKIKMDYNENKNIIDRESQLKLVEEMSLVKKLFLMREFIDYAALGIKLDTKVVDTIYEDLLINLQDYEYLLDKTIKDELELYGKDEYIEDESQMTPLVGGNNPESEIMDENSSFMQIPKEGIVTLDDIARQIYGDSYDKLSIGIDDINQDNGTLFSLYLIPVSSKNTIRLKVYNEETGKLARHYENKEDLEENLKEDLETHFNRPKTHWYRVPKLSKNKQENKD